MVRSPMPCMRFQSTLPARGATGLSHRGDPPLNISIHAPRDGSDFTRMEGKGQCRNFNPRSPRGERRAPPARRATPGHFNPRSPRGERRVVLIQCGEVLVISIHAPREGSDVSTASPLTEMVISIHAPLEGSDDLGQISFGVGQAFQSTLPARGATAKCTKIPTRILGKASAYQTKLGNVTAFLLYTKGICLKTLLF